MNSLKDQLSSELAEYKSKIQLESQKLILKNKALITENNNLNNIIKK